MVLQNNVTLILNLCKRSGSQIGDEVSQYFPITDSIMCGSIEVKLIDEAQKMGHVVRTLDVGGVSITHVHFPMADYEAPEGQKLKNLSFVLTSTARFLIGEHTKM